jgi:hypothetical protein
MDAPQAVHHRIKVKVRFSLITEKDLSDRGNYLKFLVVMSSDNEIGLII